jgi:hypothetical protein
VTEIREFNIKLDESFTGPVCDFGVGFLKFEKDGQVGFPPVQAPLRGSARRAELSQRATCSRSCKRARLASFALYRAGTSEFQA